MKIVKSTGLVPVRVLDATAFLTRVEGEVFGLDPEKAKALEASGAVEILDPPADDGEDAEGSGEGAVEIPADWAVSHHKTRISLANKLLGDQGKVETAEEADAVIAAEVAKRAA